MSQYSLKNALLIAFLTPSILLSFQTHAQEECRDAQLALDDYGQLTVLPELILSADALKEENQYTLDQVDFNCEHIGNQTIGVKVTYANGVEVSCESHVTVLDITAPFITLSDELTVYLNDEGTANPDMSVFIHAEDNCRSEVELDFSKSSFTRNDTEESVPIFVNATDAYGNTSEKEFKVIVVSPTQNDSNTPPNLSLESHIETFEFYPNPATSSITLTKKDSNLGTITILNATGKEVLSIESEELKTQIDVEELPVGLYFIECDSKMKRFIKK